MSMPVLRDYQARGIEAGRNVLRQGKLRFALYSPTGSGKTVIGMALIAGALAKGKRVAFIANRITLVGQASAQLTKAGIPHGIVQGDNSRHTHLPCIVCSIQTVARRGLPGVDLIVVDECFSGDSLVSTPSGEKRIDALLVGDEVFNANGIGRVQNVMQRESEDIYSLEFDDGTTIECTGNHPFFTGKGWVPAKDLENGAYFFSIKGLSFLWESVQALDKERRERKDDFCVSGGAMERAGMLLNLLCEEIQESNEQSSDEIEVESKDARIAAQADKARREWATVTDTSTSSTACSRRGVGVGSSDSNEDEASWNGLSDLLQDRHSQQGSNDWDRDRREFSHNDFKKGAGYSQARVSCFPRLVNISRVEREGSSTVFNIQVSGHPSYFANGKLVHNCHGVPGSKDYLKIIFTNNNVPVVGLTATPFSKGMAKRHKELQDEPLFEALVVASTIRELIQAGMLVDCEIYAPSAPDLSGVKMKRNAFGERDYDDNSLAEAVDKPALIGDIVGHWLKVSRGRTTVCFATNIAHSMHIVEQFKAAGVATEHLDGYMKPEERDAIMARMERGEITVLSNVAVLREGWDFPACEIMILARPTKSLTAYIQMAGRVLRPAPGKDKAIILDHSGSAHELGYPTDDLPLELDDGEAKKSDGKREKEVKKPTKCPKCAFMKPAGQHKCAKCGFVPERQAKDVAHEDGELTLIDRTKKGVLARENKQEIYSQLLSIKNERGYSDGWVANQYKSAFGVYPRGMQDTCSEPTQQVRSWVKSQLIRYAKGKQKSKEAIHAIC